MRARTAAVCAAISLLLSGCVAAGAQSDFQPGTYLVRQVQGQPMPVKLTAPEGCERTLRRSELVLRENGTFAGKFEIDKECAETSESDATFYDGS
ncbi:hypothetical protein BH24GEM2_BH24GEM2_00520 [soil metagenome]